MTPAELIAAQQAAVGGIRARLGQVVEASWALTAGKVDDAAQAAFVARTVPYALAAQAQTANVTSAYLSLLATEVLGEASPPVGVSAAAVSGAAVRNGATPAQVYARPTVTVRRALAAGTDWSQAVAEGLDRARVIATDDVNLAQRAATLKVIGPDDRVVGYRRTLTGASCGLCVMASTQRYRKGDLMPIHGNCVPEGSVVSVPASPGRMPRERGLVTGVLAVTRRRYAGELVVVRMATGDEVSVTPNHPVLTRRGWLPAGLLCEGDDLLSHRAAHGVVGRGPHEGQRPARVEDVWRAASMVGRSASMPLAPEDFHGDGGDGEVDVVRTDGDLTYDLDAEFLQPLRELALVAGHGGRAALSSGRTSALLVPRVLAAAGGLMRGTGLGGTFDCGHPRGADSSRPAAAARLDAPAEQFSLQSAAVYASRGLDLVRRLAGDVEADRVVETRRVGFRGHVYNLHTDEGFYTSAGHIVSNCDCGVAPIYGTADPGRVVNGSHLDRVKADLAQWDEQRYGPKPANDKAALAELRFAVHEHGELGPVLTRAGQHFTGPAQVA